MGIEFKFNGKEMSHDEVVKELHDKGHGTMFLKLFEEEKLQEAKIIISHTDNSYVIFSEKLIVFNDKTYMEIGKDDLIQVFGNMESSNGENVSQPKRQNAMEFSTEFKEAFLKEKSKNRKEDVLAEGINHELKGNRVDME
ncbi:hypothetical protein P9Z80_24190 [Bacillus cereus]|nr:hypothetical protein [Bacillus cereus]MEC3260712.1 hypothetical protein [Bacillus cereus]